jgi:hypothetical protein
MLGFEPSDEVFEAVLAIVDADASGSISRGRHCHLEFLVPIATERARRYIRS